MDIFNYTDEDARPTIDYANLPHMAREGIQAGGNNHYVTRGLFIETAPNEEAKKSALWTLAEHEVYAYGKWYPSAWMAFIHSIDEYDAARKICGNLRQWELILQMLENRGRGHTLESWRAEWSALQRSILRQSLMLTALHGGSGATAAVKQLLAMTDPPQKPGRPANKTKPTKTEQEKGLKDKVEEDAARVLAFTR